MTLVPHISSVIKSASFQLRNLGKIRRNLSPQATKQLVHAFVSSRLDMGNAILYGLPRDQIHRLQLKQNTAARLVTRTKPSAHISPICLIYTGSLLTSGFSTNWCCSHTVLSMELLHHTYMNSLTFTILLVPVFVLQIKLSLLNLNHLGHGVTVLSLWQPLAYGTVFPISFAVVNQSSHSNPYSRNISSNLLMNWINLYFCLLYFTSCNVLFLIVL